MNNRYLEILKTDNHRLIPLQKSDGTCKKLQQRVCLKFDGYIQDNNATLLSCLLRQTE